MPTNDHVTVFQARRRRFILLGMIPALVALPLLFFSSPIAEAMERSSAWPIGVAALLFAVAIPSHVQYRCPACNAFPMGHGSGGGSGGVRLDPTTCPSCSVQLKA